ncbi:MAG: putative sulfate exporter family transporter [Acidobacteriota bacterium]
MMVGLEPGKNNSGGAEDSSRPAETAAGPSAPPRPGTPSALAGALFGVSWREVPGLLPGILLAGAVMAAAQALAAVLGRGLLRLEGIDPAGRPSPVSGIMVAILIGMLVANTVGVPRIFLPGVGFAMKKLLRLGIILVGIRLSLLDVASLGALAVPVVATIVAVALVVTTWFARRIGVSENLGTLAAASTAICGVTAALAVAPVIEADEREVAYTIANVTLFGALAMFVDPYLAHALFGRTSTAVGLFLGTGIHDTSQVMGAALSYKELFHDEVALKVATVTKLTRNLFLAVVVPLLAYRHARRKGGGSGGAAVRLRSLFPLFVAGFVAMAIVRSAGDASLARAGLAWGGFDAASWTALVKMLGETWAGAALATAMAGVGLTTRFSVFRGLGARPLYVGALSATVVSALALLLASIVGPRM